MNTRRTILLVVFGIILLIGINYMLFTGILQGMPLAVEEALLSNESIRVAATKNKLVIEPTSGSSIGLVMYGEDRMDVRMYAPIARMLAEAGVKVVIMRIKLQLIESNQLDFEPIESVVLEDPNIKWFIGGHTWGAVTPVVYAKKDENTFEGIVLWAARLSEDSDLSTISLPVLYVYGDLDDANVGLLEANLPLLPPHTELVIIEGANRADFSYWGPMAADVGSTIPIPEIQKQASEATIKFIFK